MTEKMLSKGYDPKDVEDKWYRFWEQNGFFHADEKSPRPHYSIVIPPSERHRRSAYGACP